MRDEQSCEGFGFGKNLGTRKAIFANENPIIELCYDHDRSPE